MAASAATSRHAAPTGSRRIETTQIQALAGRVTTGEGERETIEIERPATGQLLGTVPRCTADDVELAVQRARAAQEQWRETSFAERRRILLAFHDLVFDRREELLDLLQLESGKARRHAFEEVLDVGIVARYYARAAERHLRTRRRRGVFPVLTAVWEHHHPVGVVGIIAPWNYPLTLSVSDAVPAFAAGNAAVVKTDTQTPFSALWGLAALEEAGPPRGGFGGVTGAGPGRGPELIDRVEYVMFTGSTSVGRMVASQAAERLGPRPMEPGGKKRMSVWEERAPP